MSTPKPTIVLVPGACSNASVYTEVTRTIEAAGYEFIITGLETVEVKSPPATMQDDAAHVHAIVEAIVDQGKDVIQVMHSYGGQPGTESAKGLLKPDRAAAGKKGGIVRLVYLTSLAAPVGESMASVNEKEGLVFDFGREENGYMIHDLEGSAKANFSDLPLEQGIKAAGELRPHAMNSFVAELTYPAYKYAPVSYIKTTHDKCLPPGWQDNRIKTIEEASGNKVDLHIFEADHCCNTSQPVETAEMILKIADAQG